MDINAYITAKLTHSLHTSERLSFRGCRRRHHWLFVERWYPQTTPKPLEFGSAFHKALETWYAPDMWGKDPETRLLLVEQAFIGACKEQKLEYLKLIAGGIDPEVEADFNERIELGLGMLRYHCKKVSPERDRGFRPIQVEIEFEVPIIDGDKQLWCKCDNCKTMWKNSDMGMQWHIQWQEELTDKLTAGGMSRDQAIAFVNASGRWVDYWKGLPVTYGGRIDMLAEDENGELWLFDWKTAARLSGQEEGDSPDEYITLDDQITSYLWALWTLGIKVAGFVHHEIKKAFPEEPEPLKRQYQGRWYSVNKNLQTSYQIYLDTITEGDPTGLASGAYNEFLEWLKEEGPRYYSRKQVGRSETELANAGRNIVLEALDITDPNLRVYPSPGRFACTFCAFRQPCIGTNRDEDVEYLLLSNFERRTNRYWEAKAPSTDSKGGQ